MGGDPGRSAVHRGDLAISQPVYAVNDEAAVRVIEGNLTLSGPLVIHDSGRDADRA